MRTLIIFLIAIVFACISDEYHNLLLIQNPTPLLHLESIDSNYVSDSSEIINLVNYSLQFFPSSFTGMLLI